MIGTMGHLNVLGGLARGAFRIKIPTTPLQIRQTVDKLPSKTFP